MAFISESKITISNGVKAAILVDQNIITAVILVFKVSREGFKL